MFTLKEYQKRTLAALETYLASARVIGPKEAFERFVKTSPTDTRPQSYAHRWGLTDVPYVCLRLPTGGGKTLLASHCVEIAGRTFMERDFPLVLWLVPTNMIRQQTVEALKKRSHPYREALDSIYGQDRVEVFDIGDIVNIRPKDFSDKVCVIIATMQTLRVAESNKEVRKVYGHNENFEPHFAGLPNVAPGLDRDEHGQVLYSFVNILHQLRPLVIVDEAHKAVSGLTGEMMQRINPACVIELTATPVESNVLFRVYASELKAEEMVKLPFMLTEHDNWEQAINGAVQTRRKLAELAPGDRENYIRPIVLIQAEKINQPHTVDAVRKHLMENEGVAESEIAVATGEQRELDGINLFDKTCPVNFVITIEALKEGWDCSFAYVFCSVANIRSATDVEQLLGRVMRMPYAKRRAIPELNNAYAHVISSSFAEAAQGMHARLMNMGFHEDEAAANLQQVQLVLPEVDLSAMPLFKTTGATPSEPPPMTITLPKAPNLETLHEDVREYVSVTPNADGTVQVACTGMVPTELETALIAANPKKEDDIRSTVALHRARVRAAQPPTASQQGKRFDVPRLMVEVWGSLELPEQETILLATEWTPLKHTVRMEPGEFDYDETARTFRFDLDGEQMRYELENAQVQFSLLASASEWNNLELVRWLDRQCRRPDVRQADMLEFCRRCVASLLERSAVALPTLCRAKYALAAALKDKLSRLREQGLKDGYQLLLFAPQAKVETSFSNALAFPASGYAESIQAYTGVYRFKNHFYPLVRDLKSKGEEFECALALDANPQVEWWVRNVDRQQGSFWLPLSNARFYPDFVAKLSDGRTLAVEYKGQHLVSGDDSKEKENIGALWEAKGNGKALFLMAVKVDDQGRDVQRQIQGKITG
ncbi:MAG: DEAD/DEAH box helicase family protein [Pseudodesulfovibrio sp.]|uniref:Type III restriction protein res subunit n=1 Tax=Pseudodesulfovibrio aespoeensis (strain ATCC 700646 / DSM 10631 / Aspo-2) TaxID=643562 RepID=E6VXX4_PSEA9|nr:MULTISPECIES: DEAD/DEAH box helicase family protein [Pseudodesulfovibrio]MBU4474344.1 DEAD/DEAH box helicase family protein [Pseudomonadota bacterium]ADU62681.1 type III restriction protein res subunit [Pseudodesulfovibrio aespoeensis Aspo-2]MBU4515618.1 DEAD/DEAH box helicase family protein [Pseudomonadota bacterium]MBU4523439.1 DEAD/DEAH box helicase family protein [Pseudomonadota bacterium]MBU4560455.1 DEAD/DEAH box helicase family protein [Pseudomonadota bacterium]